MLSLRSSSNGGPVWTLLLVFAALFSGCASANQPVGFTRSEATDLAVKLANEEARKRFGVEPFTKDSGHLKLEESRWRWQAVATAKGADVVTKVTFDSRGRRRHVAVDMRSSVLLPPREPRVPGLEPEPKISPPAERFQR